MRKFDILIPRQAYLLFEPPAVMILARTKPSIFLPSIMIVWVSTLI